MSKFRERESIKERYRDDEREGERRERTGGREKERDV